MGNELQFLFFIVLGAMFGPTIILGLIAWRYWHLDLKDKAKTFAILAAVYQLISLGVCGAIMHS